ncbi:hypothetical protein [Solidesulfovibrio carbinoliphilus]|uniref:hypothetical protein n=1 Tax=Solidesulfovibrio carbinoliphilus TaxID=345370 RepID=UPI0002F897C0|nr:hypothetical protein [Solidesulfovibrio carbinoliphilus]
MGQAVPAWLTRLSGQGCRHFLAGRCLYAEHVNPGLEEGFVCVVVHRLGRAFDDFLLRAENLGLGEEEAGRVWQARFPATLAKEGNCQDYLPGGTTSFPDCAHAAGELCLLALPACPGRCGRFFSRQG